MKKKLSLITNKKSASEGEFIEVKWNCDACPDSLLMVVDSGYKCNTTPVADSGSMRIMMSRSKRKTTITLKAITEGQVVVLDDLGRFQVTLQGKCYSQDAIAAEDFSPSAMIKSHKIVFRPDPELKKEVAKEFKLVRISSEAMK